MKGFKTYIKTRSKSSTYGKKWLVFILACALGTCVSVTTSAAKHPESFIYYEWYLAGMSVQYPDLYEGEMPKSNRYVMDVTVYADPDKDLSLYKTFAFDYTNKENRLLEKELFKMVETELIQGLYWTTAKRYFVGVGIELSGTADGRAFNIDKVFEGTPAKSAGLKPGDNIVEVNGKSVSGMTAEEILAEIKSEGKPGTDVDITVTREGYAEKLYFNITLETIYIGGLTYSEDNPDILITMNFYTGKKEEFVPPETVETTRYEYVWPTNFSAGEEVWLGDLTGALLNPEPITESHTKPGYTKVSYYRNIRLNFLDYSELESGEELEVPPLIWVGEAESEGSSSDIRDVAPVLLSELLGEFPSKTEKESTRKRYLTTYGSIGIGLDKNDLRIIRKVIPGLPGEKAGLRVGDKILKIDGKKMKKNTKYVKNDFFNNIYYSNILGNPGYREVELEVESPDPKTKRTVVILPEEKTTLIWF